MEIWNSISHWALSIFFSPGQWSIEYCCSASSGSASSGYVVAAKSKPLLKTQKRFVETRPASPTKGKPGDQHLLSSTDSITPRVRLRALIYIGEDWGSSSSQNKRTGDQGNPAPRYGRTWIKLWAVLIPWNGIKKNLILEVLSPSSDWPLRILKYLP